MEENCKYCGYTEKKHTNALPYGNICDNFTPQTTKHFFSKQEVAKILAHYIARTKGEMIVNPRLEINSSGDIVLVSDVVA